MVSGRRGKGRERKESRDRKNRYVFNACSVVFSANWYSV